MADRHRHKSRGVRVPDERWEQAKKKAKEEGKTVNDVVNSCLEKYVRKGKRK